MPTPHTKLHIPFIKALFISFLAVLFSDTALFLYTTILHIPSINWGIAGRWVVRLLHGQFYTSSIAQEPKVPYEYLIGLATHGFVAYVFSLAYVMLTKNLRTLVHLLMGPLFGLILAVFPLLIELPSMGSGFLGLNSSQPSLVLARVLVAHFSFGLGLGLAMILLITIIQHEQHHSPVI